MRKTTKGPVLSGGLGTFLIQEFVPLAQAFYKQTAGFIPRAGSPPARYPPGVTEERTTFFSVGEERLAKQSPPEFKGAHL